MVLVIGDNHKYWPRVRSKAAADWTIFIDKFVKPSLRNITTNDELLAAIREPRDGGSAFHLETPTEDNEIIKQLMVLSKEFRIYNDTFTYRINSRLTRPVLTAYTSLYCSTRWTSGTLREFLEMNKFGSRHEYDQEEYIRISHQRKTAVVVVEDSLMGSQNYALEKIPRNYCDAVAFGWISIKDSKHWYGDLNVSAVDLPALVFTDGGRCRSVYKGRMAEADRSGFLSAAVSGDFCNTIFLPRAPNKILKVSPEELDAKPQLELDVGPDDDVYVPQIENVPEPEGGTFTGTFFPLYFVVLIAIIAGIRVRTADDTGKEE
jgi:hypothetical protein